VPVPSQPPKGLARWFLHDFPSVPSVDKPAHKHAWWQVMCLTGVDYFSTLGYQPGIAYLAAGPLSPIATLVLVLVTLFAAYPVYSRVAARSPDGQGSISMLERLLPGWRGKVFVLCLLGFAATDFIITMTLSAADATAHVLENPFTPVWLKHRLGLTLFLLAILSGIFLKGFREAIAAAVTLVGAYLSLNLIVVAVGLGEIAAHPGTIGAWRNQLFQEYGNAFNMLTAALIVFPRLALGLSGFETGVAVMPLIAGDRVRSTRKLLLTAALIMSAFLIASSVVTALLIPPQEFQEGGAANGRALAYLAHRYLGEVFGTIYDLSTILILSFAGASAMAGLLNLVPRYLPRYGMAPWWARASRPLVLVFMGIAFTVTILFRADVDAQGGAYATGVLVLITSAAVAVTIDVWGRPIRWAFLAIVLVFGYTTVANIIERPEGIKIASFFIFLTVSTSLISRALRATELRICDIEFDRKASDMIEADADKVIRVVAHRPVPNATDVNVYDSADRRARDIHNLSPDEQLLFIEIERGDTSDFDAPLKVEGVTVGRHQILRAVSPAIPNAIAALLIELEKTTGRLPHAYFGWTEGNPIAYMFRFLFLGEGDVAPVTREVLREAIKDPHQRPYIHVA